MFFAGFAAQSCYRSMDCQDS